MEEFARISRRTIRDVETNIPPIEVNAKDKARVYKLNEWVIENLKESDLNNENLASYVLRIFRQLNRKLNLITGLSSAKFLKEERLQSARKNSKWDLHNLFQKWPLMLDLKIFPPYLLFLKIDLGNHPANICRTEQGRQR